MTETSAPAKSPVKSERFKQRLGIFLCVLYALVYAAFVVVSVLDVTLMDTLMPFGLNLAVFHGLGLILLALILAVLYSLICGSVERSTNSHTKTTGTAESLAATEPTGEGVDA